MQDTSSTTHQHLPVEDSTIPFWHRDLDGLHNHRTTAELLPSSDVVIVGAGYAGIATAYHLVKGANGAPKKLSVTVLEARGICSGATGRNGGHLRPDMYGHIPKYMDRAGVEAGLEIAEFEISHLNAIKTLVETEKIDCDFTLTRTVDVWINEAAAVRAKGIYDLMKSRNLEYMNDVFFVFGKDAEGISGIKGARACATYTAGTMWPYKFILHLARSLLKTGLVNIQTNTPVNSVVPDPAGGYIISTPRGTMHAKKVVYANNAYVGGLLPEYQKAIVPCKGVACHISVPEGSKAPLLSNSYTVREEDNVLSYLIPRPDGSIVVGGANARYHAHPEQWYNNVDDGKLIELVKGHYHGFMQKFFQGWEKSDAAVTKIWSGIMGYSYDSNPHIGKVPGKSDQYVLAGFNGHGMPVIWLGAKGVAEMILNNIEFKTTGIPKLFETTQERLEKIQNCSGGGDILTNT